MNFEHDASEDVLFGSCWLRPTAAYRINQPPKLTDKNDMGFQWTE